MDDFKYGFQIPQFLNSPQATAIAFVSIEAGVPDPTNSPSFAVGVGATGSLLCSDSLLRSSSLAFQIYYQFRYSPKVIW